MASAAMLLALLSSMLPKCAALQMQLNDTSGLGPPIEYDTKWTKYLRVKYQPKELVIAKFLQSMHIYVPTAAAKPTAGWPVLVLLHGQAGDRDEFTWWCEKKFVTGLHGAPRVCVLPDWVKEAKQSVKDMEAIILHLKENSEKYGLDPCNIVIGGWSLGGILAASGQILPNFGYEVKGTILLAGIMEEHLKGAKCGNHYPPNSLVLHAEDDNFIPIDPVQGFVDKLESCGTHVQYKKYPKNWKHFNGVGHNVWKDIDFFERVQTFLDTLKDNWKNGGSSVKGDKCVVPLGPIPPVVIKASEQEEKPMMKDDPVTPECEDWCATEPDPWPTKLKWSKCLGCTVPEVGGMGCDNWCATDTTPWPTKLKWPSCDACTVPEKKGEKNKGGKGRGNKNKA